VFTYKVKGKAIFLVDSATTARKPCKGTAESGTAAAEKSRGRKNQTLSASIVYSSMPE